METGSDKPEKPLHKFPVGSDGLTEGMRGHLQREGERARLERELIEAAKRWVPKRGQHGTHHTARQCPTCAAERAFYKATHDLIDFDSQHGIQK